MNQKRNRIIFRILSIVMVLAAVAGVFTACASDKKAAENKTEVSPVAVYAEVVKAYGDSFPLSTQDRISEKARIFGVKMEENVDAYYAAQHVADGSKSEYALFICQAKDGKTDAVKDALNEWLENEKNSLNNYLDDTGKKLFAQAKIGNEGDCVYLLIIDTADNATAIDTIKNCLK